MIEPYKKEHFLGVLSLFTENKNTYCYITKNNKRFYIKDGEALKLLLKECKNIYIIDDGGIKGIICSWKGIGEGKERIYLKLFAVSKEIANSLLSFYLSLIKKDLYIKIDKTVDFLPLLFQKGFKFLHGRGKELLLIRKFKENK